MSYHRKCEETWSTLALELGVDTTNVQSPRVPRVADPEENLYSTYESHSDLPPPPLPPKPPVSNPFNDDDDNYGKEYTSFSPADDDLAGV